MSEQGGNPNDLVLGAVPYEGARMGVFRGAAAGGAQPGFQYAQLVLGVISPPTASTTLATNARKVFWLQVSPLPALL